jgi:hypothetical protein
LICGPKDKAFVFTGATVHPLPPPAEDMKYELGTSLFLIIDMIVSYFIMPDFIIFILAQMV